MLDINEYNKLMGSSLGGYLGSDIGTEIVSCHGMLDRN